MEVEFNRITSKSFTELFGKYINTLYNYTKGMPLACQLVAAQLALNTPIEYVIKGLESGKTYESLLEFCFRGSLEKLNEVERGILFILSIPTTEEFFSIDDLEYITRYSEDEISFSLQKLSKFSLCYSSKINESSSGYATPHLAKLYVRKFDFDTKHDLFNRYVKFAQERSEIADASLLDEQYLIRSRAKTHEQRLAALSIKNVMSVFYLDGYESAIKLIDAAISKCSDFGYLYYIKAVVENSSDIYQKHRRAITELSNATRLDPDLIDAWILWGYIENEQKQYQRSLSYFKEALRIDPNNHRANHGYAYALSQLSRKGFGEESEKQAKEAEVHYKKAYYQGTNLSAAQRHHNAINAHSHALNLMINLNDLNGALEICKMGLQYERNNNHLLTLQGEIKKKLKQVPLNIREDTNKKAASDVNQNKIKLKGRDKRRRSIVVSDLLPTDVINSLEKLKRQTNYKDE